MPKFALLVPVRNAGAHATTFLKGLSAQSVCPNRLIAVDSESSDESPELFEKAGFEVISIPATSFDHGSTRQQMATLAKDVDVLVFMTQDAILASPLSLHCIVKPFDDDSELGAICGRQLPSKDANPFAIYARAHNYPEKSYERSKDDFGECGIKTAFMSNSFAAYRKSALDDVGGFPTRSIFGEDLLVAAKMLLRDYKIRYEADATVLHSHNYSLTEEFRRYFDVGVMRNTQNEILSQLGSANSQARKMLLGEMSHLVKHHPLLVPISFARAGVRFAAYQAGKLSDRLPNSICKRLSFCQSYWRNKAQC